MKQNYHAVIASHARKILGVCVCCMYAIQKSACSIQSLAVAPPPKCAVHTSCISHVHAAYMDGR